MVYKCKFIEVHTPVFFNGKNYGTKLTAKEGIELFWDDGYDKCWMTVKNVKNPCIFGTYHVIEPIDFHAFADDELTAQTEIKPRAKPGPKPKEVQ